MPTSIYTGDTINRSYDGGVDMPFRVRMDNGDDDFDEEDEY